MNSSPIRPDIKKRNIANSDGILRKAFSVFGELFGYSHDMGDSNSNYIKRNEITSDIYNTIERNFANLETSFGLADDFEQLFKGNLPVTFSGNVENNGGNANLQLINNVVNSSKIEKTLNNLKIYECYLLNDFDTNLAIVDSGNNPTVEFTYNHQNTGSTISSVGNLFTQPSTTISPEDIVYIKTYVPISSVVSFGDNITNFKKRENTQISSIAGLDDFDNFDLANIGGSDVFENLIKLLTKKYSFVPKKNNNAKINELKESDNPISYIFGIVYVLSFYTYYDSLRKDQYIYNELNSQISTVRSAAAGLESKSIKNQFAIMNGGCCDGVVNTGDGNIQSGATANSIDLTRIGHYGNSSGNIDNYVHIDGNTTNVNSTSYLTVGNVFAKAELTFTDSGGNTTNETVAYEQEEVKIKLPEILLKMSEKDIESNDSLIDHYPNSQKEEVLKWKFDNNMWDKQVHTATSTSGSEVKRDNPLRELLVQNVFHRSGDSTVLDYVNLSRWGEIGNGHIPFINGLNANGIPDSGVMGSFHPGSRMYFNVKGFEKNPNSPEFPNENKSIVGGNIFENSQYTADSVMKQKKMDSTTHYQQYRNLAYVCNVEDVRNRVDGYETREEDRFSISNNVIDNKDQFFHQENFKYFPYTWTMGVTEKNLNQFRGNNFEKITGFWDNKPKHIIGGISYLYHFLYNKEKYEFIDNGFDPYLNSFGNSYVFDHPLCKQEGNIRFRLYEKPSSYAVFVDVTKNADQYTPVLNATRLPDYYSTDESVITISETTIPLFIVSISGGNVVGLKRMMPLVENKVEGEKRKDVIDFPLNYDTEIHGREYLDAMDGEYVYDNAVEGFSDLKENRFSLYEFSSTFKILQKPSSKAEYEKTTHDNRYLYPKLKSFVMNGFSQLFPKYENGKIVFEDKFDFCKNLLVNSIDHEKMWENCYFLRGNGTGQYKLNYLDPQIYEYHVFPPTAYTREAAYDIGDVNNARRTSAIEEVFNYTGREKNKYNTPIVMPKIALSNNRSEDIKNVYSGGINFRYPTGVNKFITPRISFCCYPIGLHSIIDELGNNASNRKRLLHYELTDDSISYIGGDTVDAPNEYYDTNQDNFKRVRGDYLNIMSFSSHYFRRIPFNSIYEYSPNIVVQTVNYSNSSLVVSLESETLNYTSPTNTHQLTSTGDFNHSNMIGFGLLSYDDNKVEHIMIANERVSATSGNGYYCSVNFVRRAILGLSGSDDALLSSYDQTSQNKKLNMRLFSVSGRHFAYFPNGRARIEPVTVGQSYYNEKIIPSDITSIIVDEERHTVTDPKTSRYRRHTKWLQESRENLNDANSLRFYGYCHTYLGAYPDSEMNKGLEDFRNGKFNEKVPGEIREIAISKTTGNNPVYTISLRDDVVIEDDNCIIDDFGQPLVTNNGLYEYFPSKKTFGHFKENEPPYYNQKYIKLYGERADNYDINSITSHPSQNSDDFTLYSGVYSFYGIRDTMRRSVTPLGIFYCTLSDTSFDGFMSHIVDDISFISHRPDKERLISNGGYLSKGPSNSMKPDFSLSFNAVDDFGHTIVNNDSSLNVSFKDTNVIVGSPRKYGKKIYFNNNVHKDFLDFNDVDVNCIDKTYSMREYYNSGRDTKSTLRNSSFNYINKLFLKEGDYNGLSLLNHRSVDPRNYDNYGLRNGMINKPVFFPDYISSIEKKYGVGNVCVNYNSNKDVLTNYERYRNEIYNGTIANRIANMYYVECIPFLTNAFSVRYTLSSANTNGSYRLYYGYWGNMTTPNGFLPISENSFISGNTYMLLTNTAYSGGFSSVSSTFKYPFMAYNGGSEGGPSVSLEDIRNFNYSKYNIINNVDVQATNMADLSNVGICPIDFDDGGNFRKDLIKKGIIDSYKKLTMEVKEEYDL